MTNRQDLRGGIALLLLYLLGDVVGRGGLRGESVYVGAWSGPGGNHTWSGQTSIISSETRYVI